jgi:UDP-N-acetylglucosamine--N-acetylmuramyl-(pentapeptide) pyrophosphoryl-undecaprenol N-acetylglucosamine transferase
MKFTPSSQLNGILVDMRKVMKVLTLAGGSGGHVTPAVAVIRELKRRRPTTEIRVWCDHKYAPQARSLVHGFDTTIPVQTILSGKLRRYHNVPLWRQLTSPSVVFPNIRDLFLVIAGFGQSIAKFVVWRPDVVFAKGGFASVPAGLAARLFKIPLVIHDSDSHPGLANRILARFATSIATGAPLDNYPYNRRLARYTGIPISQDFRPYADKERREMKVALGFEPSRPLVVVTGGGLGAGPINAAVAKQLKQLLGLASLMLLSGTAYYDKMRASLPHDDPRFQLLSFLSSEEMVRSLGAADIVVSRAGATTILELSALAKPAILIPAAQLAAGHQLKNAAEYAKDGAVEVIGGDELAANPQVLVDTISSLLADPVKRQQMAKVFHALSRPNAAKEVADLIERAAEKKR